MKLATLIAAIGHPQPGDHEYVLMIKQGHVITLLKP